MRTQQRRSRTVSDFSYRPLAAAVALALAPMAAQATTFTVTSASDSGPGTLRDAITQANAGCTGFDTITFSGPFTIDLATSLPSINCGGLTVKGPGTADGSTPAVKLTSSSHGAFDGLQIFASPPVTVKGMEIYGFNYGGGRAIIGDFNASNNRIHDNNYGMDGGAFQGQIQNNRVWNNSVIGIHTTYGGELITGNVVFGNGTGISVEFMSDQKNPVQINNNFVGVDSTGARLNGNNTGIFAYGSVFRASGNVVSGNLSTGFSLTDDQASIISNNLIGTDATGTSAIPNSIGISSSFGYGTQITGNTISGNLDFGIDLSNENVVLVDGNSIGANKAKNAALLNGGGIHDSCSSNNQYSNNVIGTKGGHGIDMWSVFGGGDAGTVVNNKIGVMGDGVTPLGNNAYGIYIGDSGCDASESYTITGNTIANSAAANLDTGDGIFIAASYGGDIEQNTITNNRGYGVNNVYFLSDVRILNNKIYGNAGSLAGAARKNVNLDAPGAPRPNDAGDTDSGPNNGQNWPNIDSVIQDLVHSQMVVNFTLDSNPGTYTIQVFANPSGSHVPGGERLMFTQTGFSVSGPTAGTINVAGLGVDHFSLTATNESFGDTSEYSPVVDAQPAPALTVSPTTLDFGTNVTVGTNSLAKTVNIRSAGGLALTLDSVDDCYGGAICSSGDFSCQSTCVPGTMNPGTGCTVSVTFHPSSTFPSSNQFCVNTREFATQFVTLMGTGAPPPVANLTPANFDFGSVLLGSTSDTQGFTVYNPQSTGVGIGTPGVTNGDFVISSTDCSFVLGPGANCTVNVAFSPSSVGPINGELVVGANIGDVVVTHGGLEAAAAAVNSFGPPPATANLSGTGAVLANLTMPDAVDMGAYLPGNPALSTPVNITASGNAALTFTSITVDGPFTLTNNCGSTLPAGQTCNVVLSFSQQVLGSYTGNLTVMSNAQGGTRTVPVTATTVGEAAPHIKVSPVSIGFGSRMMGTQSGDQKVTLTSDGTGPATIGAITSANADYIVTGTSCGVTLDVGSTCFANVALRPAGFGFRPGALLIQSNSPDSPATVTLEGTGCQPFNAATVRLGGSSGCSP